MNNEKLKFLKRVLFTMALKITKLEINVTKYAKFVCILRTTMIRNIKDDLNIEKYQVHRLEDSIFSKYQCAPK